MGNGARQGLQFTFVPIRINSSACQRANSRFKARSASAWCILNRDEWTQESNPESLDCRILCIQKTSAYRKHATPVAFPGWSKYQHTHSAMRVRCVFTRRLPCSWQRCPLESEGAPSGTLQASSGTIHGPWSWSASWKHTRTSLRGELKP